MVNRKYRDKNCNDFENEASMGVGIFSSNTRNPISTFIFKHKKSTTFLNIINKLWCNLHHMPKN